MKKVYFLISGILISVVLNHFFYSNNIIDVATNQAFPNALLQWPSFRIFIEPFYAFAYYILTLERSGYVFALCSWIFWSILFVLFLAKYYKVPKSKTVIYCFFAMFFVVSLICSIIILPVAGPKLSVSDKYKVVDIHSHSISSKDNLSLVSSNINFHNKHGYTDFFITEHDNTNGYDSIPGNIKTDNIFPGIQIRTEGISVLLLSKDPFNYYDFKGKTIQEMVDLAHSKDMLVVVPHVWKWKKHSLQSLADKGVDGFEIYNCGYRFLKPDKKQEIVNICKDNNLMMFGTTDWHGLGYMSNVWSLVEKEDDKSLFDILKDSKPNVKVINHNVSGWQSVIRYIFEPFFAFYYYIVNTKIEYILSFYMIMSLVVLLFFKFKVINVIKFISLSFALFFAISLFYFTSMLLSFNFTYNVIIPETIVPTALSLIFIWLIIWGACEKNI